MPINPIALISGALSFSAALSWNKAINETMNDIVGNKIHPMIQATIITLIIILIVFIINIVAILYSNFNNIQLNENTIRSGGDHNSKVKLWL